MDTLPPSPIKKRMALQIFKQILNTFALLKKYGIYHRDIKAENILIDLNTNTATLIDFGFAIFSQDGRGTYIGHTDWYASPEV